MAKGFFNSIRGAHSTMPDHASHADGQCAPGDHQQQIDLGFTSEMELFKALYESMPTNVMYCDRDLILRGMNRASRETLRSIESQLPIKVNDMIGNSIHIFHKSPPHVETVLGAGHHHGNHQLPHHAVIQIGTARLDLNVAPINNQQGVFVGCVVSWTDTTKALAASESKRSTLLEGVDEINQSLTMISSATHEINASIGEIAKNATQLEQTTHHLKTSSDAGLEAIEHLKQSGAGVAQVANLIAGIATQTSVLALNATIEAARAGAHGKGFSVVAGEVKKLAEQTTAATSDIQKKVATIRTDVTNALDAINNIVTQGDNMNGLSHMLASAAEEQRLATNEMTQSLETCSGRTASIAQAAH